MVNLKKKKLKNIENKTLEMSPNVGEITINVNGLYAPARRQRLPNWIKKIAQQSLDINASYEIHSKIKGYGKAEIKRWKKKP